MAEKATKGVAGRRNQKVITITAAPTPTPTRPENADTNELNHADGAAFTDCTASSTGRSKKNGAGWSATSTVSAAKSAPATMATDIHAQLMSPKRRCGDEREFGG